MQGPQPVNKDPVLRTTVTAQESGGATITVSIPKDWAEELGISKGTLVEAGFCIDGTVRYQPHAASEAGE